MMKANIKLILVALAFLFISSIVSAAGPKSYGLYFPNPLLKSGERIDQIDISVSCGHIEAITHIPKMIGTLKLSGLSQQLKSFMPRLVMAVP